MKYGLIGCGRISPNHIAAAKANHLELAGICDIDENMLKDKVLKFGLEHVHQYSDYHEIIRMEKPELVAIATESGKHAAIALDCIEAGCNLIIEKPIALSLADTDAIIEAAKEKGVKVCASHQNRFNKSIQKIREALEQERFGGCFMGQPISAGAEIMNIIQERFDTVERLLVKLEGSLKYLREYGHIVITVHY